ncbi:PREDICTED: transmembrane inner ear expressed protein [Wasmannia auropunctata]|uniref:transmembrane inner ear expressed protein n=1 Tax=Wasmannia auropunctata TaxID=64793 RepID=UPI0005F01462|nr:PREDICTED: transmembrane inner ear expressed protein [Wasmannia auropunctata]
MEETALSAFTPSGTLNEAATKVLDTEEQTWLEKTLLGFRIWQLAGIVLSVLLSIVVGLCCCIRFRVPRTKQEIEADYIRKRITRSFRNELSKISNTEMDEMDLQKALDRIRSEYEGDTSAIAKECAEMAKLSARQGFRTRFNAVFDGMRVRFSQREHATI